MRIWHLDQASPESELHLSLTSPSRKSLVLTALVVGVLLVTLVAGHEALAAGRLLQTVPTRTPAYTLPPGRTHTPGPNPTSTPEPPGTTITPPAGTATLPTPTPPLGTIPSLPGTETPVTLTPQASTQPSVVPGMAIALVCMAEIGRQDVLPGEEVEYTFLVTNPGTMPAGNVALRDQLVPGIELLRVSATQGAVDVASELVTLRLGTIEPGQSALAILDLRINEAVSAGQVFVLQAAAYFDGGTVGCDAVAFAMPPNHLPNTGASRMVPRKPYR